MPQDVVTLNTDLFETHMHESRVFPPPAEFSAKARLGSLEQYEQMYARSVDDSEGFWGDAARELEWFAPWERVLDERGPHAQWFTGGKLNLSHNCVDRHAKGPRKDKVALVWEGEPVSDGGGGEVRRLTYGELQEQVQAFANVLKSLGVKKGDRVAVYMGMCPELAIALLACARVGAVHLVVFGGFGAQALSERIKDAQCKLVISQDGLYRRGTEIKLKSIVDEAVALCPTVEKVLVHRRRLRGARARRRTRSVPSRRIRERPPKPTHPACPRAVPPDRCRRAPCPSEARHRRGWCRPAGRRPRSSKRSARARGPGSRESRRSADSAP